MAKDMTVEEAVRIIKETYEFGDKFDEAVAFLKEHDAGNEALVPFKDAQKHEMIKKARAKAYAEEAMANDERDARFDEAVELLKDDKDFQAQEKEEQEIYDKENHLDMTDEDAVLRNTRKIGDMADSFMNDEENAKELEFYKDKVEIVDDSGQQISDDEAQKYWNSLLESAKEQATMLRAGDLSFFMKK